MRRRRVREADVERRPVLAIAAGDREAIADLLAALLVEAMDADVDAPPDRDQQAATRSDGGLA